MGDRVQGKVSRLADFGAFIELVPGVDGLIHVSEMSWSKKVRKPSDVLKVGEMVEAVVLAVNAGEHRISLGLKQALGDPWEEALEKYPEGAIVEGAVTSLQPFGAFVDLGNGIEGMIHIGDISREKRLDHPKDMLKTGRGEGAGAGARQGTPPHPAGSEATGADECGHFIAENQVGEVITGRIADVSGNRVKAELAEGVYAPCRIASAEPAAKAERKAQAANVDLSSMTAMLKQRWKQGAAESEEGGKPAREQYRPGQIVSFKITGMDAAKKTVDVEFA